MCWQYNKQPELGVPVGADSPPCMCVPPAGQRRRASLGLPCGLLPPCWRLRLCADSLLCKGKSNMHGSEICMPKWVSLQKFKQNFMKLKKVINTKELKIGQYSQTNSDLY